MIIGVQLSHEGFFNDVAEELRLFFASAQVVPNSDGDAVMTVSANGEGGVKAEFLRPDGGRFFAERPFPAEQDPLLFKRHLKRAYKLATYDTLKQAEGRKPSPWGSLTGIRPTKFARGLTEEGFDVRTALRDEFDLSGEKIALLMRILEVQRPLLHTGGEIDVYIGIPFCTTRCSYCSFAAEALKDYGRVQSYLTALFAELGACVAFAREAGVKVRSVYVGGGTPTSLSDGDFRRLLESAKAFDPLREFVVEAGRPDTITNEKLAIMAGLGVTRTSINPQTMSDETLERIGRGHTAHDIKRAFALTRGYGLPVNMDIIIGLPGETREDVRRTLDGLGMLSPESLTVHTLALKRASKLVMSGEAELPSPGEAEAMLGLTQEWADANGLLPYYLYRQKYMAGNLENVGYAKPGYECLYNIDIMEETTSILALGAGAISKWVFGGGRLERLPNPKDIGTYIARIQELIQKKLKNLMIIT